MDSPGAGALHHSNVTRVPRLPAYLLTGPEELLLARAAERIVAEAREGAGELDVLDVRGPELKDSPLPDLRTGNLFGTPRLLLVREAQLLPPGAVEGLLALLAAPPDDATVVLLATSTKAITKLAKRIKDLGGVVEVGPPKEWETRAWRDLVAEELRRHRRAASAEAVVALLAHAGNDVSLIAEKAAQVAAAVEAGREITAGDVERHVVGHGSRGSFAVADAMCDRDPASALTLLRGCYEAGDHPVMVLGALAYRMRALVAVASGVDARAAGLSLTPAMTGRLKGLRRNFGPGELTEAVRHLAEADLEIKSGELSAEVAVERAVLAIAAGDVPVPRPTRAILR